MKCLYTFCFWFLAGHGDLAQNDQRTGCVELLRTIQRRVKPKYHIFGHIHEGYGITTDNNTTFVNASTCTVNYKPTNKPIVFDLPTPKIPAMEAETSVWLVSGLQLDWFDCSLQFDWPMRLSLNIPVMWLDYIIVRILTRHYAIFLTDRRRNCKPKWHQILHGGLVCPRINTRSDWFIVCIYYNMWAQIMYENEKSFESQHPFLVFKMEFLYSENLWLV